MRRSDQLEPDYVGRFTSPLSSGKTRRRRNEQKGSTCVRHTTTSISVGRFLYYHSLLVPDTEILKGKGNMCSPTSVVSEPEVYLP